ncbi:MAG: hypothetical protein OXFUSZZB_000261, partial [Candidatus Fervidibacter sp.]
RALYVGENLFHVAQITVDEGSRWVERTVGDLEGRALSIVLLRRSDGRVVFHPAPTEPIKAGDTLVIVGEPDEVAALTIGR